MIHKTKNKSHILLLIIIVIAILITFAIWPDFYIKMISESDYSMILLVFGYLPGFFILMGLFEVWLPEKFVVEHLGKHSGVKGSIYSWILGTILPGPLYVAFPIASQFVRKGVSIFNTVIFIGAWSCFKLGEEVFELQFLGLRFLILRIIITIPFIIIMAFIIDKIHFRSFGKKKKF